MTREQAVSTWLRHSKKTGRLILRLMLWNEKKPIKENSLKLKMLLTSTRQLASFYKLKYVKHKTRIGKISEPKEIARAKQLYKMGFNQVDIARLYNLSKQRIGQITNDRIKGG